MKSDDESNTGEESDDESNTDEEMDDEIFNSDDEDEDVDNDNKFHLLHIINDTRSIFEYCIKLRKEYRIALKQFNNLNEEDTRSVIKSYAKLEVIVKDDQFGIENDNNNNESDDDFWDFVFEFRDILEEDTKLLDNYVTVEKEIILSKKDIDKDVPMMGLKEIINSGINLMTNYQKHGDECFETCSNAQIHSVGGMIESFNDPETTVKIRNFNPHKYDLIRDLMEPYIKSIEKIGNSDITIHEKRKTLQKTHVGETVINLISNVILPYLKQLK